MIDKIEELAVKFGKRTAYIYGNEKRTFEELFFRAQKISEKISGKDKSPVVVLGGKNCAVMESILACIMAKRAYVPINLSIPKERREYIIKSSKAGIIIDCTKNEPEIISIENGAQNFDDNEIAYIIFTSGSTGKPKGVPISYENLDNFISWITELDPGRGIEHAGVLNQAEFSFDLSTAAIFCALFCGYALIQLSENGDFFENFEIIKKNRPEVLVVTPSFVRLCLINKDFCEKEYPFIKSVYFCGEPLQKSLVKAIFERFSEIRIINAYGPTEATSAVCAFEITKESLEKEETLPCGDVDKAAVKISIENGEIVLKGKSVFKGYLENINGGYFKEEKTDCYRTGDFGFIKSKKLYCLGRKDDQVKYKGYRIELSEIESNIFSVSGVENCAVLAKQNAEGEVRMIKAFVSGTASEASIRNELSKKLPEYMVPKTIKILDFLPLNQNGKIDRKELEHL